MSTKDVAGKRMGERAARKLERDFRFQVGELNLQADGVRLQMSRMREQLAKKESELCVIALQEQRLWVEIEKIRR